MSKRRPGAKDGFTEQKLLRGWATGTAGVKVRLATAADLTAVEPLMAAAGVDLHERIVDAVHRGVMGRAHRAGLSARGPSHGQDAFLAALAPALVNPDDDAFRFASLLLVAEHAVDGVVGTVLAYPPPSVVDEVLTHADRRGAEQAAVRQGFEVKQPGEGLDLQVVFGFPAGIRPVRGERLFVRARPAAEPRGR